MWKFLLKTPYIQFECIPVEIICCPLRHFIRYVCSESRKSNNHFSQPLLSAFSCGLRYLSAQLRFSCLVYRLPRFQSK